MAVKITQWVGKLSRNRDNLTSSTFQTSVVEGNHLLQAFHSTPYAHHSIHILTHIQIFTINKSMYLKFSLIQESQSCVLRLYLERKKKQQNFE